MKMFTFSCTLIFTVLSSLNLACQNIVGSGNVVKVDRNLDPFSSVSVSHGWDLILNQGDSHGMTIEADENLIADLRTEVRNDHLRIYFDEGVRVRQAKRKRIYLTFKDLSKINASGGSDVTAEGSIRAGSFSVNFSGGSDLKFPALYADSFSANMSGGSDTHINFKSLSELHVDASGGSDLHLENISGAECHVNLSGGSDINMDGNLEQAFITASGGSDLKCSNLNIQTGRFNLSGGSDGRLGAIDEIDLTLGGSSDFICHGNPKIIRQNVSKSSSFKMM